MQDDAFGGPAEAVHNSAPFFMPLPAILVVLALIGVWVIWQFLVRPGMLASRRVAIWEAVRDAAHQAARGEEREAAHRVLYLQGVIREKVGHLIAGGEMCAVVTGVRKALDTPPKLDVVAAQKAQAQFGGRSIVIQESLAPAAAPGEPAPEVKPEGPKSANAELHKVAQDFKAYWDKREERLRDLEDAQRRLGV